MAGATGSLRRKSLTLGPLAANCHLLFTRGDGRAVVCDPGSEPEAIIETVESLGLTVEAFFLTHAHIDHIGALAALKREFPAAPVYLHAEELAWLEDPVLNGAEWLGLPFEPVSGALPWPESHSVEALGRTFRLFHSPGHSPGSTVIYSQADDLAVGGDVLFRGSIGRTDLPGGDPRAMSKSLRALADELPPGTLFLTGHGPETTLAVELLENPYVKLASGGSAV
ncbi:MAG: MBL fold metallo-hydrolase [Candidatus Sumerlaeia bacterium]|nr:MBL fold metallo-hydrolase [Candidatus Sumerlaeia bacterium]